MFRSTMAAVTGLLAAVLLPVSLLSVWVHDVVSDTDTYVETVTPLADNEAVQAAAVTELQREVMQLIGTPGASVPGVQQLVHAAVERVVQSPAFRTAWIRANRIAHEQVVAVLEGRSAVTLNGQGLVTIDLNPVFHDLAQNLTDAGLPGADRVAGLQASIAIMRADQLSKARRAYDVLDTLGLWLPVAWAVLVALTLVLARRRLAATAKLAIASLLALGLLALALLVARSSYTRDLPQRDAAREVWNVVTAGLWHQIVAAAIVLVITAVVAAVLAAMAGRSSTPPGPPGGVQQYR